MGGSSPSKARATRPTATGEAFAKLSDVSVVELQFTTASTVTPPLVAAGAATVSGPPAEASSEASTTGRKLAA